MSPLDYRCRAVGCCIARTCRRYIPGDAGKASPHPYAAYDHRRTGDECDGYLPRIMAPVRG